MENFSPLPAIIGGLLIGLAAAVLWLGNGRIAGISGIFGELLPPTGNFIWRTLFLVAMIAGAFFASYLMPGLVGGPQGKATALVAAPVQWPVSTPAWLAVAGLLTGVGTRVGNGCTSGHGVCGIARLSKRSVAAVGVFFGVAILTVAVTGVV